MLFALLGLTDPFDTQNQVKAHRLVNQNVPDWAEDWQGLVGVADDGPKKTCNCSKRLTKVKSGKKNDSSSSNSSSSDDEDCKCDEKGQEKKAEASKASAS